MLTPLDIHDKEFSKSMRGYKPEEVDSFLDQVIKDFESLFRENHDLKEKIQKSLEESERIKELEASLQKTLLMAQQMVEDQKKQAERESELIIWESKKKGEKILEEAQVKLFQINANIDQLKLYEKQLNSKFRGFLEFQLELLTGFGDEAITFETGKNSDTIDNRADDADLPNDDTNIDIAETIASTSEASEDTVDEDIYEAAEKQEPESVSQVLTETYEQAPSRISEDISVKATTSMEKEALLSDDEEPSDEQDNEEEDSTSLEQVIMAAERVEAVLKSLDENADPKPEEGEILHGPWRK